jgi:hypothetical protein
MGSAGNQTQSSIDAYRKYAKDEPDHERHVARMERELVESQARRRKEQAEITEDTRWRRHV